MEFLIFSSVILVLKSVKFDKKLIKGNKAFDTFAIPLGIVMFFLFIRFFIGGFATLLHSFVCLIISFLFLANTIKYFLKEHIAFIEKLDSILRGLSLPIGIIGIIIGFIGLFLNT